MLNAPFYQINVFFATGKRYYYNEPGFYSNWRIGAGLMSGLANILLFNSNHADKRYMESSLIIIYKSGKECELNNFLIRSANFSQRCP
jgi:hypothetical protein